MRRLLGTMLALLILLAGMVGTAPDAPVAGSSIPLLTWIGGASVGNSADAATAARSSHAGSWSMLGGQPAVPPQEAAKAANEALGARQVERAPAEWRQVRVVRRERAPPTG